MLVGTKAIIRKGEKQIFFSIYFGVVLSLLYIWNMGATKEITTKQYAKLVGCSAQNISKHIRQTGAEKLKLALDINYYSRFVLIVVPEDLEVPPHED